MRTNAAFGFQRGERQILRVVRPRSVSGTGRFPVCEEPIKRFFQTVFFREFGIDAAHTF
jgi:hypothetical protein